MTLHDFIDKELREPLDKNRVLAMSTRPGLGYLYYDDLKKRPTLKQLLPSKNSGKIILFIKHDGSQIGHFCLLFRHERSGIHFFDPYGLGLRKVLEVTNSTTYLEELLHKIQSKHHNVHINRHAFQQMKDGNQAVQTCGRHCITRWNACHMTPKEYEGLMHHRSLSPDEIVTIMTIERDLKDA